MDESNEYFSSFCYRYMLDDKSTRLGKFSYLDKTRIDSDKFIHPLLDRNHCLQIMMT